MADNAKQPLQWEEVHFVKANAKGGGSLPSTLYRCRVPGGWLIAVEWGDGGKRVDMLPDVNHDWDPLLETEAVAAKKEKQP